MDNHLGGRPDAPNVIIYLTTANPPSTNYAVNASRALQAKNVTVVGVGVDVAALASVCTPGYVVNYPTFDAMMNASGPALVLRALGCGGGSTWAPVIQTSRVTTPTTVPTNSTTKTTNQPSPTTTPIAAVKPGVG